MYNCICLWYNLLFIVTIYLGIVVGVIVRVRLSIVR